MNASERTMLIRRGNELYNNRDYKNALKIYLATSYQDGIGRIASVMEHEKQDPVAALKLYKKAGMYANVEKLALGMAKTIRLLLEEDKIMEAQNKGENFNRSYKISGASPVMLPSDAIRIAREKLGLENPAIAEQYRNSRIVKWNPINISRSQLHK